MTTQPTESIRESTRESIRVTGARENNLRDVTVQVPKRAITAFVGVSGSGKSSLVFDTIAAEAQRQLNETFSAFVRGFLPKLGQPDADLIENLSTAIVVDQKRLGGGSRSTLGTVTDINPLLRLLWSRRSEPHVGPAYEFSFNEQGMCPTCNGIGRKITLDHNRFFDRSKSLDEGAIRHRDFAVGSWYWALYAKSGYFDNDKPLAEYTEAEWKLLLHGSDERITLPIPGRKDAAFQFEGRDEVQPALHRRGRERRVDAEEGRDRAVHHHRDLPGVPRGAAQRGRSLRHRRRVHAAAGVRDGPALAARPAAHHGHPGRGAAGGGGDRPGRRAHRHGPGLPHARPRDLNALRG
ncbi:excinuclease ABC subunit UvrA [Pseudonocardia thermophila]|uniref:hypothetical protein n=1 Tax=Pseudonocardia thermophila TaxID=1848 RepID=UPI000AEB65BD